jgi:hypothetical protein
LTSKSSLFFVENLIFRLDKHWELFHLLNAVLILAFGVAGSVMLTEKVYNDENKEFLEEERERLTKKKRVIEKNEYLLYDDEDEEKTKKDEAKQSSAIKKSVKNANYMNANTEGNSL